MKLRNYILQILAFSFLSGQVMASPAQDDLANMGAELLVAQSYSDLPGCYTEPSFKSGCSDLLSAVSSLGISSVRKLDIIDADDEDFYNNPQSAFKSAFCFKGYEKYVENQDVRIFCGNHSEKEEEVKAPLTENNSNFRSKIVLAGVGAGLVTSVVVGFAFTGPAMFTLLAVGTLSGGLTGGTLGKYYYESSFVDGASYGALGGTLGSLSGLVLLKLHYAHKLKLAAAAIKYHGHRGLFHIRGSDCTNGGIGAASNRLISMFGISLIDAQSLLTQAQTAHH